MINKTEITKSLSRTEIETLLNEVGLLYVTSITPAESGDGVCITSQMKESLIFLRSNGVEVAEVYRVLKNKLLG